MYGAVVCQKIISEMKSKLIFYTATLAHRIGKPGVSPLDSSGTRRCIQKDKLLWKCTQPYRQSGPHAEHTGA